jgi:hypothetical protein
MYLFSVGFLDHKLDLQIAELPLDLEFDDGVIQKRVRRERELRKTGPTPSSRPIVYPAFAGAGAAEGDRL